MCCEIDGSLDENSAEYVRNLSVKAAATIEKLQSQPSPEKTDHPPATVTREQEPKGSTVSLTDHVWSVQKPFFIMIHIDVKWHMYVSWSGLTLNMKCSSNNRSELHLVQVGRMVCMERKASLVFLVLLILGLGFSAVSISLAGTLNWPMFHHDPEHTGTAPEPVTPPLALLWKYPTDGGVESSPAVSGGVVYVGSNDFRVYALNASTGAHLWNYTTGDAVWSSPAVCDGVVYIGSDDCLVYALNASTGAHIWNYTTGDAVWSSPAVSGGIVYVGSFDNCTYALNATTGEQVWNYTTDSYVRSSPAVCGGVVYVGSDDNRVYALNASTGAQIWNYTTGGDVASSPAFSSSVVYVGSLDDHVYALDASTGAHIWNYTTSGFVTSSPAVSGGVVYIGSHDNCTYALDASTGTQLWNYTTGGWVLSSPAVCDGVVYIGSRDNRVYALNATTGAQIWNYTTGDRVVSSPAVCGGVVYIGSCDGWVYAFAEAREVSFSASGLGGDCSGTVLTVDGFNYGLSDLPKAFTWAVGSQHSFEWASAVPSGLFNNYLWNSTAGLSTSRSGSVTVPDGKSSITAF
jgi:outer membrane protein assembly factor BamB